MKKIKAGFTKKVLIAIIVVGVFAILLLYALVYMKYSEKTKELENSNWQLSNSLIELQAYYENQEKYEADTKLIAEVVDRLLEDYPADTRPEDVIMLAVELQEEQAITYSNINMDENELVYEIPQETVAGARLEGLEEKLCFMCKRAGYVNVTDYENLKECVEQIYENPSRIAIENIAYVKDKDSDMLEGTIDLVFYYATGTGKEYVCPDIAEYLMGTENIFQ